MSHESWVILFESYEWLYDMIRYDEWWVHTSTESWADSILAYSPRLAKEPDPQHPTLDHKACRPHRPLHPWQQKALSYFYSLLLSGTLATACIMQKTYRSYESYRSIMFWNSEGQGLGCCVNCQCYKNRFIQIRLDSSHLHLIFLPALERRPPHPHGSISYVCKTLLRVHCNKRPSNSSMSLSPLRGKNENLRKWEYNKNKQKFKTCESSKLKVQTPHTLQYHFSWPKWVAKQ